MKKIILLLFMELAGLGLFLSCDEDYTITFPTWKGFTLNKHSLECGDTLKITAHLDKPGKWLYSPKYTWTLTVDTIGPNADNVMVQKPCAITYIIKSKPNTLTFDKGELVEQKNHIETNADAIGLFRIPENAVKGKAKRMISFNIEYQNSVDASERTNFTTKVKEGYEGYEFSYSIAGTLQSRVTSNFSSEIEIK